MVEQVHNLAGSFKCAFIRCQVVLIVCLRVGVTKDFTCLTFAQTRLNPACVSRSSQAAKTQAMRFAMLDLCSLTSGLEGSLNGCETKDQFGIVLSGFLPQEFQFFFQSITDRGASGLQRLSGQRGDLNKSFVNILPPQFEHFACSHSSVDGADQHSLEMFDSSRTGFEQPILFFEGHDSRSFAFVGSGDKWVALAERALNDPSFAFGDIEESTDQSKFPVNAGDGSTLPAFGLPAQSGGLVGLKIGVGDRTDSPVTERRLECPRIPTNRVTGAQPGDLAIIDVGWSDGIAVEIPIHHDGQLSAGSVETGCSQGLPFSQRLAETVPSFGLRGAGTPQGFPLSVLHPGDAGIDAPILDDDLQLVFSGHREFLYGSLYFRGSCRSVKTNLEPQSDSRGGENQANLQGVDVLSCREQDTDVSMYLTSNQKVAGSSPAGCTKTLSKFSHPKKSNDLRIEVLPGCLYAQKLSKSYS